MLKKDIAREDMSSAEDDFQRECQITSQLDHPNIVKVFGAGRAEGRQYIEMEFVNHTKKYIDAHNLGDKFAKELLKDE